MGVHQCIVTRCSYSCLFVVLFSTRRSYHFNHLPFRLARLQFHVVQEVIVDEKADRLRYVRHRHADFWSEQLGTYESPSKAAGVKEHSHSSAMKAVLRMGYAVVSAAA